MVIFGHADYLNRGSGNFWKDPFLGLFPECSAGDVAVKSFFFLSGLLISNSLLKNSSVIHYFVSRTFRILPSLIFVLLLSSFVIGPILTNLSIGEYFRSAETYTYFFKGSLLKIQYFLPGVFTHFSDGHTSVNGSLWTLPLEFRFYLLLFGFFLLTGFKRLWLVNIILGIALLESLFGSKVIISFFGDLEHINLLPIAFFFGVYLGVNSKRISLDFRMLLGIFLLFLLFKSQSIGSILFIFFYCGFVFYIGTLPALRRFRPAIDVSYGIYLWGYLVQQVIYQYFGTINIWAHFVLALCVSILLAVITHYVVEKPFITYGKRLSRYLRNRFDKASLT